MKFKVWIIVIGRRDSPVPGRGIFGNGYTGAGAVGVSSVCQGSLIGPGPSQSLCYLDSNAN